MNPEWINAVCSALACGAALFYAGQLTQMVREHERRIQSLEEEQKQTRLTEVARA